MSKINWNGSQSAWRAKTAQPGRDLRSQPSGKGGGLQNAGYLTLAGAFVAVAAGSAGATLLAISLMSAEVPELAGGAADVVVAEAQAAEIAPAVAAIEQNAVNPGETAVAPVDATQPAGAGGQVPATLGQVAQDAEQAEVAALESSDPRWAQFAKPAPPLEELRNDQQASQASAFGSAGQSGGALAAVKRAVEDPQDEQGQDSQETAAIAKPPRINEPKSETGGRQIVLNTAANVRSRSNKSGKVLGAIPAGVKVTNYGCQSSWCEVSYKGLRGWVYSGFVSGNGQKDTSSAQRPKATQAAAQRQKMEVTPAARSKADGALPGVKTNEPLPTVSPIDKSGR